MRLIFIVLLVFTLVQNDVAALNCLECNDAYKPYFCDIVAKCIPGEKCFIDQYVTSSGQVLYKTGCKSTERCSFSKRGIQNSLGVSDVMNDAASDETTDIVTCSQCCNNTDYCNLNGCQQTATDRSQRGPLCFDCRKQTKHGCRHFTQCDVHYVCEITTEDQNGVTLYNSQCVHPSSSAHCYGTQLPGSINLIGKRYQSNADDCPKCCDTDFCNEDCSPSSVSGGLLSDWGPWSACTRNCGQQVRHKTCIHSPCSGPIEEVRNCSSQSHCPVDGGFSEWGPWTNCSIECIDFGHQQRCPF